MMSQEWLSIIAAWEFLFALLLLFAGSLVHWRKAKHNLLLLAAIGFAVAVAGNAYLSYIIFFPGVLSSKIGRASCRERE